jgi:nucleoside-diphosphate-sugar epimerase
MSKLDFKILPTSKVLVTGATGFVGGHLARRLLAMGSHVTLLVRQTSNKKVVEEFRKLGAKIVYGDVADRDSVFEAVEGVDYVFHIAALYRQTNVSPEAYTHVNVDGVRNILEASEKFKVKRVMHCSTIGVHNNIPNPPAKESEGYRPGDIYQVSKCEGEKLALSFFDLGRLEGVVIRPAMIWGEGDNRILKLFKGVSQRKMPIIGTGKIWTHWIYVEDLVDAFLLAAESDKAKGQVYFIAGRRPVTLIEVSQMIADEAGVKLWPFKIPVWPVYLAGGCVELICKPFGIEPPLHRRRVEFFTKDRWFDISKAQKDLGYEPRYDVKEEVGRIYSWYKENNWL